MSYRCCVGGCDNTNDRFTNKGTFYDGKYIRFPEKTEKRKLWNRIIGSTTDVKKYVCSEHFSDGDWRVQDVIMHVPLAKRKIKPDAVPSRNLPLISINKGSAEIAVANDGMNEETRKRLVAEALAEYEEKKQSDYLGNNSDSFNWKAGKTRIETGDTNLAECDTMTYKDEVEISTVDYHFAHNQTRKCGEITVDIDDQTFALNCFLCSAICLDLFNFAKHVQTQHASLLHTHNENSLESIVGDIPLKQEPKNSHTEENPVENVYFDSNDENPKKRLQSNTSDELCSDNQALVTQVIYLLKQNPVIWDKTHPLHTTYRKRKTAIISITNSLSKTFVDLTFTYKNVTTLLSRLRATYRNELKVFHQTEEKNLEYIPRVWYLNKLKFLGGDEHLNQIGLKQQLEIQRRITTQPPFDLHDINSPEIEIITLKIIALYEQQPSLWNNSHPCYSEKFKNIDILQEFLKILQSKYPEVKPKTTNEWLQVLEHIHRWFSVEESIRMYNAKLKQRFQSNFPRVYTALEFLRGIVPPFRCDICSKVFDIKSSYLRHIRQQSKCAKVLDVVVHECDFCRKRFATPPKLKRHLRTHTNERPYTCSICDKSFRSYTTWFRHGRTHSQIKPFKCGDCQRAYYTASMLRIHQKVHLGIRDQICDICGKSFTSAKYLYRHRDVHLNDTKYECNVCLKKFKQYTNMLMHRKRCSLAGLRKQQIVSTLSCYKSQQAT